MYKQCKFKMVGGDRFHHAWIPVQFAVKGKILNFRNTDGMWGKPSWEVISVGDMTIEDGFVRELERDYLHQRKASDI